MVFSKKEEKRQLEFVQGNWRNFPTYIIYQTSCEGSLVLKPEESIFLYSIHKVKRVRIVPTLINSIFFRVFTVKALGMKEPVGFVFIPNGPEARKIRYSPISLVVTTEGATLEAIKRAEKKVLLSNDHLEMYWLSCGVEVVTDLGAKLGVSL